MRTTVPATISIDPRGARDLDDALAATAVDGGWRVDLLIPDVPSLVQPGGDIDLAARQAGLTSYDAGGIRHPMLPLELVDRLSLSSDEDRPIIHVEIAVGADLRPTVTSISRHVGRTVAALTYDQADYALDKQSNRHHVAIAALWDLARRLAEDRATAIGATFDESGATWIDEEGRLVTAGEQRAHRANILVMELMILANGALARHARDNGVAVLYRNHILEGFARGDRASAARELALRERIGPHVAAKRLKAMSNLVRQAAIGTEPLGHFGLDLDAYGWFTSPLRRYADLVSLRALLDGHREDDLAALASRLTGQHRSQNESSDGHHGRMSRRKLLSLIDAGDHEVLERTALHVVIRALDENPGFDRDAAMRHVARRMAADALSGRDIAALSDSAATLFGEDAAGTVGEWVAADPARILLLAEHRSDAPPPIATKSGGQNHKGRLLELAQRHKAYVRIGEAKRTGSSHAPIFTVTMTWNAAGTKIEASGMDRTIRNAEQAAAKAMLDKLDSTVGQERSSVLPPNGAAPKTRLLELATATGADVRFGDFRASGPPHAPRFSVEVRHVLNGEERTAYGEGASKREAERKASEHMLSKIGA